jgi:hypothetical protein
MLTLGEFNFLFAIKPLTCRHSFVILFLENNLNRKDPMAIPLAENSLAGGITIDLGG